MKSCEIPTAREMGAKLGSLSRLLYEEKLIQSHVKSYIDNVSKQLKKLGKTTTWKYTLNASRAIEFLAIKDKKLGQIAPRVYIQVAVKPPETDDIPPFTLLNTTIEVWDILNNDLQSRWHIDLANRFANGTYQAGPLFHLQGGGHKPQGDRKDELKVSIPRWDVPPMELILTCERIVANFYPDTWEKIRKQERWLELIQVGQQLCYPFYFQRIQNCLTGHQQSVLNTLWASEW